MFSVPLSDILAHDRNNFDTVRVVAAASVIVSHAFSLALGADTAEPLASVSAFTLAQHAVNVFFVLSGVLVASSLERSRDLAAFVAGRVLRIVPGLAACVLAVALLLGPLVSSLDPAAYFASPETWSYVAATLSLSTGLAPLPGVFETLPAAGEVNVPLWTLKYEVFSYALLTVLAAAGIWARPMLFRLFLAVLALAYLSQLGQRSVADHGVIDHVLRFSVCFYLGVAAYRMRHRLPLSVPGAVLAAALLVAANGTMFEEPVSYAAVGYLMLCFAALPLGPVRRLFARADLSFGLYIYGWPVAQTVLLLAPGIGPVGLAAASLAGAAAVAAISWTLVEKPALALKRRLPPLPARGRARRMPA